MRRGWWRTDWWGVECVKAGLLIGVGFGIYVYEFGGVDFQDIVVFFQRD